MPNRTPEKLAVNLTVLVRQIAKARAVLAGLERQIAFAQHRTVNLNPESLLEVNERLVVAAMQHQTDVDSAMQALDAVTRSAQLDSLTQLPNRAMMNDRFVQAIANAKRHDSGFAILFIDLNGFKQINDSLGHTAGDEVLRQISQRLVGSVRDVDTVSRHGGDEFLILLPEVVQRSAAALVAKKLGLAIGKSMVIAGGKLRPSASIGFCLYPENGTTPQALIECADAAMYKAKRQAKCA